MSDERFKSILMAHWKLSRRCLSVVGKCDQTKNLYWKGKMRAFEEVYFNFFNEDLNKETK
jgi:hypothetical protein